MVAELAAAATVVAGVVGKMVPYLLDYLGKNHKLRADLKIQINSITNECEMISALIDEDTDRRQRSGNGTHKKWITMVRDLAYDIDDTIDRFTRQMCVTLEPDASWIRRTVNRMTTRKARNKFAAEILRLKKKSGEVSQLKEKYSGTLELDTAPAGTVTYTPNPVGMDIAREELMELIRESPQGRPDELRVISVVGFGGIGKTQLAKYAYDTTESEYPTRSWVTAAERSQEDVLKDILLQLGRDPTTISSSGGGPGDALCKAIKECLVSKRFLIVIDDIGSQIWDGITDAFPKDCGIRSRVIVTTVRHSIAKKCSHDSGVVYEMTTLDEHHSRQLLIEKASMDSENPPLASDIMRCSEALKKCDGLPLALVTTGNLLQSICDQESWTYLCEKLGQKLEANENFVSMKHVLVRSYTSLGAQDVKTCLLYLGIYPSGRPIRRASLVRRWLAEGFIADDRFDAATVNFKVLAERSIIRQLVDANSTEMKTCQTHGMMLEFILHNTDNFVTLLGDKATLPSNVRWLSLHDAKSQVNPNKLRLVRSLTIFGEVHKSALDFSKFKLMRVLDLEECHEHLEDKHLKEICSNLFLLRYLSLRGAASITVLPKEIKKLHHLETLDVRRTKIEIMPTEVMELPCLVYLFGKLKLQGGGIGDQRISMLQTWLSENSILKTVAGFVVDERQEMPQLIQHMEDLTKVKIWCESTPDASINISHLTKAIKGFIERGTNLNETRSLSLNFNAGWPQDLLCFSLEEGKLYYLSSLKLQGNICSQLPVFVANLYGLTKLCLSFSGQYLSSEILDSLSKVRGLEYMKLIATQMGKLVIREGEFESLQSLCIVLEVMSELIIVKGALQRLVSLQLLCKDLKGFSSTKIQSLPRLEEVALHDELGEQTKQEWKNEAKKHPRYPKVLCKLKASELVVETSTATTSTGTLAQGVVMESKPGENPESPVAPQTDRILSIRTPAGAISTEDSVQDITADLGSEPTGEIPAAPGSISAGEPVQVVPIEMGSKSAAEISPAAIATDMMTQAVTVESEHVENFESSVAPPTYMTLSLTIPLKDISNGKSGPATTDSTMLSVNHNTFANAHPEHPVQVDGQRDDQGTEDVESFGDSDAFSSENGLSTSTGEMDGGAGLEGQQMEDGTQAGEHEAVRLVEAGLGERQTRPGLEMPEKAEKDAGKDDVDAK